MSFFTPLGHPMKFIVSTASCFGPCHVSVVCASMFKGSIRLESHPSQIYCLKTYVCPCSFDPPIYISMSVSCRRWGIHQGPPSTSLFLSTSTHYPGIMLRNQLVLWDLHASMAGLLASDSGFTSLTSNQMIP